MALDDLVRPALGPTATGGWTLHRWGWQFSTGQALDEAYVRFFGAFGAAWDDALVARWNADPLGMLWPEREAVLARSRGGGSDRRPLRGGRSS